MEIKKINDIYKMNIICTNIKEVMECKDILEKLGLKTIRVDNNKERIIVRRVNGDNNFFTNCDVVYTGFDNISFYDFKKQAKKLIPILEDIEFNKEDGRITRINNSKSMKKFYLSFNQEEYIIDSFDENRFSDYIDTGLMFFSSETRDKARNKRIIENKLKNIANRLNNGKINWSDWEQNKYYISYDIEVKKVFLNSSYYFKHQGIIYCLSDKFLKEAIKEISESELIKYFKE